MKMRDGVIYEDNFNSDDGLYVTNANATDAATIRSNLAGLINSGGTGPNSLGSLILILLIFFMVNHLLYSSNICLRICRYYGQTNRYNNFTMELKIVGLQK